MMVTYLAITGILWKFPQPIHSYILYVYKHLGLLGLLFTLLALAWVADARSVIFSFVKKYRNLDVIELIESLNNDNKAKIGDRYLSKLIAQIMVIDPLLIDSPQHNSVLDKNKSEPEVISLKNVKNDIIITYQSLIDDDPKKLLSDCEGFLNRLHILQAFLKKELTEE